MLLTGIESQPDSCQTPPSLPAPATVESIVNRSNAKVNAASPPSQIYWSAMILTALFIARLFVETEAPELGHTLWLTTLTLGFVAGSLFLGWRSDRTEYLTFSLPDLAVMAIVLGHWISGVVILLGHGHQRAALNMMWEWLALGLFWCCLRSFLGHAANRSGLVLSFLATVIALCLLGIWQHYYWYPSLAGNFEELAGFTERIETRESLSSAEQRRYQALLEQLGTSLSTLDATGRQAFLARVRDSVEPIGLFALANTFASLPMVALLLLVSPFLGQQSGKLSRASKILIFTLIAIVFFCLILTKSRTAWVGTFVGLAVMISIRWKHIGNAQRIVKRSLLGVALLGSLLLGWAFFSGGLDRQVISEAPKSLQYRLEYWSATLKLLQETPLLGAGPGNFRQRYLKYKLPGSSEEILDPHNLLLGIWAGGGLIAVLGLLILLSTSMRDAWTTLKLHADESVPVEKWSVYGAVLLAVGMVWAKSILLDGSSGVLLPVVGVVAVTSAWMLRSCEIVDLISPAAMLAALVALTIHLLGASGIEMPAIVMLLLVLSALLNEGSGIQFKTVIVRPPILLGGAFATVVLMVSSVFSSVVPVQIAQTNLSIGEFLLVSEGNLQQARKYFLSAAAADSLSPVPPEKLGLLHLQLWQRSGRVDHHLHQKAVEYLQQAIQLDPFAAGRYRLLGNIWDQRYAVSNNPEHGEQAVAAYNRATQLYPNFAPLRAEYAFALHEINADASTEAEKALALDELNRSKGHTDKFLPDEVRNRLVSLLDSSKSSDSAD